MSARSDRVRTVWATLRDTPSFAHHGPTADGGGGSPALEGDHAMLASKPLTGYRCLACDRWANQQNSKAAVLTVPPLSHVATCVAVSRLKVQLLSAVQVPTSVLWDSRFTQVARASRIATDQWPGILSAWTLQAG